jgi:hypothetical protein
MPKKPKVSNGRLVALLLVSASVLSGGCTLESGTGKAQKIPRYANSFQNCRPDAYAPDVAALVPECKPSPPGATVYQLTTTVWTSRPRSSAVSR